MSPKVTAQHDLFASEPVRNSRLKARRSSKGLVAAVDLGASKAACLIASVMESADGAVDIEVIGAGQQGIAPREARTDRLAAAEKALRAALDAAEHMAGERVRTVSISAPGRQLLSRRIGVDLDLSGGAVTGEDVVDCLREGAGLAARDGARAIHASPIEFSVDGERTGANPCGFVGDVLSAELVSLSVRDGYEANMRALLERCDLGVDAIVPGPLATGDAVLIDDEKELGVTVIDMGARTTDFAIYENGALVGCGGVAMGGEHITRDLAHIFGGSIAHAERVKALYGSALSGVGDDHRFIDFPQLGAQTGSSADALRTARADVTAVIAPRLEETLTLIRQDAARVCLGAGAAAFETDGASSSGAGAYERAYGRHSGGGMRRVVLTGGGSLLTGARETAERILGVKTRLGRPVSLSGAPDAASAAQFSACVGALLMRARPPEFGGGKTRFGAETDYRRIDPLELKHAGFFQATAKWLKANF